MIFKKKLPNKLPPTEFTGTCFVKQYTADYHFVGRCYHATYDFECYLHGNVSEWLSKSYSDWPRDYELRRNDGDTWWSSQRKETDGDN